ncbi:MAG: Holliday junction resolvase RuvX [Dehalococcoidia bacterium]
MKVIGRGEMRSLGLDIGGKRTGVAISDPQGILATPLTVLISEHEDVLIDEILKLAEQYNAERIVVGLPCRLNGEVGWQAAKVTALADKLSWRAKRSRFSQLDVQLWDERLSTKAAERLKAESNSRKNKLRSRAKKGTKNRGSWIKAEIDAIAAAVILQGFLDSQQRGDRQGA